MKTIGLLGGMSWESTQIYYQYCNQQIRERIGGLASAKIILDSVDFSEIVTLQKSGQWDIAGGILAGRAKALEGAGAECLLICTNTMHLVADQVQKAVSIPLIHIVDSIAATAKTKGFKKLGLLATSFTMTHPFYRDRFLAHGIELVIPESDQIKMIHEVIFDELCRGVIYPQSKANFLTVIDTLTKRGVEGVVLGCTEIQMLISSQDTTAPLLDSTKIHADAAVTWALSK